MARWLGSGRAHQHPRYIHNQASKFLDNFWVGQMWVSFGSTPLAIWSQNMRQDEILENVGHWSGHSSIWQYHPTSSLRASFTTQWRLQTICGIVLDHGIALLCYWSLPGTPQKKHSFNGPMVFNIHFSMVMICLVDSNWNFHHFTSWMFRVPRYESCFISLSQWTLKKKMNCIFSTKYVIPKSLKFSSLAIGQVSHSQIGIESDFKWVDGPKLFNDKDMPGSLYMGEKGPNIAISCHFSQNWVPNQKY